MPIALQTLAGVPFFQGLSAESISGILEEGQVRHVSAHTELLHAHSPLSHLIVVLQGQLQLSDLAEDGRIIRVSFANQGDLVGLLSVIDEQPIVSNVVASMASDLLLVPLATARKMVFENPEITARILKLLARHVRKGTEERRLLSLPNAFQRVFAQLVSLSQQSAMPDQLSAPLPKQHDIAVMVNTSRETVSRALQLLIKKGIMVKDGHKIMIRQPEQLRQLAHEGLSPDDVEGKPTA